MEQMTFSGSCSCTKFRSNPFAKSGAIARVCADCGHDIQEHSREAVTEKDVLKALESNESQPSLILGTEQNGLYQGGWQAAINEMHLVESKTGLVINTAGGLENHFPKFRSASSLYERLGINVLHFDWEDSDATTFTVTDMRKAQESIQATLDDEKSVLVHCAQGRSRSGSVVVYYVSRSQRKNIKDALASVQAKRAMCQPNKHFMELLIDMKDEDAFPEAPKAGTPELEAPKPEASKLEDPKLEAQPPKASEPLAPTPDPKLEATIPEDEGVMEHRPKLEASKLGDPILEAQPPKASEPLAPAPAPKLEATIPKDEDVMEREGGPPQAVATAERIVYSLEDMQDPNGFWKNNGDIDASSREQYLSDADFESVFDMTKAKFAQLPKWKRNSLKTTNGLF